VLPIKMQFTFDGALPNTTLVNKILPQGAIILCVDIISDHSGGTVPLFDIGLGADPDGIINGAASTTTQRMVLAASEFGVLTGLIAGLTADLPITAGDDGSGTAGTGNITAVIEYVMADDGAENT